VGEDRRDLERAHQAEPGHVRRLHAGDVAAGSIRYNGRDITGMKPADVARLGLVRSFQISAVFP
jgi:ABC-type uncharacterized transport system ATPase subunit